MACGVPKCADRGVARHIDIDAALTLLSGWTGVDFSRLPLDAGIEYIDSDAGRSALASFSVADPSRIWTVREAAQFIGIGGRGPVLIGDPVQVADQLETWMEVTGIDGFNLAFAVAHESMRDVVEQASADGIHVTLEGSGVARAQLPPPGSPLRRGERIRIVFAR